MLDVRGHIPNVRGYMLDVRGHKSARCERLYAR